MMAQALCDQLFADVDGELQHPSDAEDLFGILEAWEDCVTPRGGVEAALSSSADAATPKSAAAAAANGKRPRHDSSGGDNGSTLQEPAKRQRCSPPAAVVTAAAAGEGGAGKMGTSHIAVERNRRKQMNEHLAVLRSLMPCFYVKRGDQASIIGGVVDYIKELQQLLQSLEAKKQRRAYTEQLVLSPRPPACCSPRPPLSPRLPLPVKSTPPRSPRPAVPISPRTPPTPNSPYKLCRQPSLPLPLPLPLPPPPSSAYASPALTPTSQESSAASSYLPSLDAMATELCAYTTDNNSKQQAGGAGLPEVKVEFSGANLVVKTVSQRAPGQAVKVIAALEGRALEILHAKISTVDDTAVNSFTIKIGIECDLSAEELVQEIQQAFS